MAGYNQIFTPVGSFVLYINIHANQRGWCVRNCGFSYLYCVVIFQEEPFPNVTVSFEEHWYLPYTAKPEKTISCCSGFMYIVAKYTYTQISCSEWTGLGLYTSMYQQRYIDVYSKCSLCSFMQSLQYILCLVF